MAARLVESVVKIEDMPFASINTPFKRQTLVMPDDDLPVSPEREERPVAERLIYRVPGQLSLYKMKLLGRFTANWNRLEPRIQRNIADIIDDNQTAPPDPSKYFAISVPQSVIDKAEISNSRSCLIVENSATRTLRVDIATESSYSHRTIRGAVPRYKSASIYKPDGSGDKVLYSGHIANVKLRGLDQSVTVLKLDNMYPDSYDRSTGKERFSEKDRERAQLLASLGFYAIASNGERPAVILSQNLLSLRRIFRLRQG